MEVREVSGPGYVARGEGVPILMLPGMEGSKVFWRFQLEGLSSRYRVVACDLAVRRPTLSSTMSDYAADALRIMDSLGLTKAVVVGESFGGMVAQQLAVAHSERVLALVLCNTMDRPRRGGFGLNMFTLATFVHQFAFLPFLSDSQRKRLLGWVGKHRGFIMDPSPGNADLVEYILEYGTACGPGCYLDRMIAAGKIRFTNRLGSISVPTLVLRGVEDRLVGPGAAVELAGRIPGAQMALIDGGGHCCPRTVPGATNEAILRWLDEVFGAGRVRDKVRDI